MKTRTINIIFLILIFISCKNKTTELEEKIESKIKTQIELTKSNSESTDKMLEFLSSKYSHAYEYKEIDSRQLIGINFITKDSIDYYLSSETLPCDTKYYGKAINKNYELDPEIDEDENGISYPANEYLNDQKDYVIYIRISLDSTKVKIGYTDNETDGTDCVPNTISTMKKIK